MCSDKKFLLAALLYMVIGLGVGVFMAASHNHAQHVTHAHILLVGFVLSLIYAVIHKLWITVESPAIANAQFILHQLGAIGLAVGLWLLYGNIVAEARIELLLGGSSLAVLAGALLMFFLIMKERPEKA